FLFLLASCYSFFCCYGVYIHVSCYFTDHSESLDLTTNFSSSTFDNGQRKEIVLVSSLYLGLAPAFLRLPPHSIFCEIFGSFVVSIISISFFIIKMLYILA